MRYVLAAIAALCLAIEPAAAQSANPLGLLFEPLNPRRLGAPPMPWQLGATAIPAPADRNAAAPVAPPPVAAPVYPPAPRWRQPRDPGQVASQQVGSPAYRPVPRPRYGTQTYQPAAAPQPYAPEPRRARPNEAPRFGLFSWFGGSSRSSARDAAPATPGVQQAALQPATNEEYLHRRIVASTFSYEPGTVVIDTGNRFLYLQMEGGQALRYGVGVGRQGFEWSGTATIGRKAEWPDWIPPEEMREREPWLPERMAGGIDNPLGARALYLFEGSKDTLYRIHGTNQPETIGQALSSGCIRMLNEDVMDLYQRVPEGSKVVVI